MEKLTYERIADVTLKIDLHNGYEVVALAIHNFETKKYEVSLYIQDKQVDNLILMEEFLNVEFKASNKNICAAILKYVAHNFENFNFDKYIARCKYEQQCFEEGDYLAKNRIEAQKYIQRRLKEIGVSDAV